MHHSVRATAFILLLAPAISLAQEPVAITAAAAPPSATSASPAFYPVPELMSGFHQLYEQKFQPARETFNDWHSNHPEEPLGDVALGASFLFEEMYRQGVLTSDFFLNEKKFLHGIDGKPDSVRMNNFRDALSRARILARQRLKTNPKDPEALFALTLAAGMESDADAILEKKQLDGLKRMKEANEYAKQLLAVHPDASDAYVAPGIANYIIGSLNPGYRFALWFGGIHGDKKLGMEQIANTVESGRYLRPFAKIMLALAARREKQSALAQKLLHELTEEFPSNDTYAAEYAKAMGRPVPAVITR
jgi:hypothetical protein